MGAAAIIGAVAQTGMSIYSQERAARENKAVNRFNARMLGLQAVDAERRGEIAAGNTITDYRQLAGAQKAAVAGQGIDLSSPTAERIAMDTEKIAQRDVSTVRANAAREAWGYRMQAKAIKKAGRQQYAGAQLNTAGSAITGTANTVSAIADYRRNA